MRICRNTADGVTGIGIIDEHPEILNAAYKQFVYERFLVERGGNKKGFLQVEGKVTQEVLDDLKTKWKALYENDNSNMLILNNGLKFVESSNTSVEMQLNESKNKNNELICQIFGLSPSVVSGKANDDEYIAAIKTAIMPVVAALQAALDKSMLLWSEKSDHYFTLDTKELLKGDILKRYKAYQIALHEGFLQVDEVRYEEDKEPFNLNWIKLGLQDVLFDTKNHTIYTPNTNQTVKFGEKGIEKSVDNDSENDIIETRYNDGSHYTKDEHGRFTGSTSSGGGSSSNGGGNGKLNENNKKPITPITEENIAKVPNVSILGYTAEQCQFIQQQHKELLRYSHDNNGDKEVAFVFNGDLKGRKEFKGEDDRLDFGSALYGKDLFVMHNHPRNSSYSTNDIVFLLENDNVKTLTIVKNNGSIETLSKTAQYNKSESITAYKRQYKKYVKSGSDKEIDSAINHFIKSGKGGLQWRKSQQYLTVQERKE